MTIVRLCFAVVIVALTLAASPSDLKLLRDVKDNLLDHSLIQTSMGAESQSQQVVGSNRPLETQILARFFLRGLENLELVSCSSCPPGSTPTRECSVASDTVCEFQSCDGREINPMDTLRTYSSIYGGDTTGAGHGRGRLDSDQAWSSANNQVNSEYAQLDLGFPRAVANVVLQPRKGDANSQRVKKYKVKYSTDGNSYFDVDGGFEFIGNNAGEPDTNHVKGIFRKPIVARFWRVYPSEYKDHMSMRWGVGVCTSGLCTGLETNPPDSKRSFSSIWNNDPVGPGGAGHGQSRLDSPQAWSSLNNARNSEFLQIDLENPNARVSHVILQARVGNTDSQRVTRYRVKYSRDSSTWFDVDAGDEFVGPAVGQLDSTRTKGVFSEPIVARYWRLIPMDYASHMSARWGLGVCQ